MPVSSKPVLSSDLSASRAVAVASSNLSQCIMSQYNYYYYTATPHVRRNAQTLPAGSGIESVQLSQHFQPASNRDGVSQFSERPR